MRIKLINENALNEGGYKSHTFYDYAEFKSGFPNSTIICNALNKNNIFYNPTGFYSGISFENSTEKGVAQDGVDFLQNNLTERNFSFNFIPKEVTTEVLMETMFSKNGTLKMEVKNYGLTYTMEVYVTDATDLESGIISLASAKTGIDNLKFTKEDGTKVWSIYS